MAKGVIKAEVKKQDTFSRAYHSIRTRYSLATAIFLLTILAMFYVGGRIVLVHFLRDTETLVQDLETSMVMRPSPHAAPANASSYGIVPMVSEAFNFYSGGFWEFNTHPQEAASLSRALANVTTAAMSRLTFFIAMAGIILILPIFWFQSHILLNPLTRMIESIRSIGEHHDDTDCPRLVWTGKDEFAQLAISVNSMLETLSRRAVTVAQSESRLKALLANLPDGLVVFDRRHLVVAVTKQPDGVKPVPGIVEGCPLNASAYEDDASRKLGHALDGVLADGKSRSLNLNTSEASGERRSFELRLARMDEFFVLSSIRDVTAEQAEHDLRVAAEGSLARLRKQESLSLLAAGIAHDVNNVLAVVLNTMEITWMDEKDPLITSALDTIRDAVKRGTGMMRELMTFAGETKINLRRCDPAELINAVSRLAAGPLGDKVSINYVLPEGLPAIDADPDQFWRIFFNLAKNAAEAMNGQPGEIAVSADVFEMTSELAPSFTGSRALKPGPGVLFWVSDNGPGIPPEVQKRIFDPYVSTKATGHGLGLAIVASIVAAHGGGISVQSDPAGGTTFSIFIPESKLSADVEVPAAAETGNTVTGDVLVVDDDKGILMTSQILLKALGHVAHAAADPDTALDAFRRFAPRLSCVILDANLANFDSVHLLRALRLADARVPVIVSSGATAETTAEMFKAQPYNGFLAKPYTLAEMKAALAKYGRATA